MVETHTFKAVNVLVRAKHGSAGVLTLVCSESCVVAFCSRQSHDSLTGGIDRVWAYSANRERGNRLVVR